MASKDSSIQPTLANIFRSFLSIILLHWGVLSFILLQKEKINLTEPRLSFETIYIIEIAILFSLLIFTAIFFFMRLFPKYSCATFGRILFFLYVISLLPLSLTLISSLYVPPVYLYLVQNIVFFIIFPLIYSLIVFGILVNLLYAKQIKLFPFYYLSFSRVTIWYRIKNKLRIKDKLKCLFIDIVKTFWIFLWDV